MASLTSLVTIKFKSSQLEPVHLFVKRLPDNEAHLTMLTESKQFVKEAAFFMDYLPEVQKLCKKMGQVNLMDIYPKCYYGNEKLVVLENLILNKGFMLHKREDMQNFDAAKFALTTLAKHHALSYALIKNIGGQEEFFKRFQNLSFQGFDTDGMRAVMLPFVEDPLAISINILSKSKLEGKNKAIEVLRKYQGKAYETFMEPLRRKFDNDNSVIRVLNHGDYWNGNMMFLKDGKFFDGHVMTTVDFQLIHLCTPAVYVGYYLFTSVKPAVRQAKLEELLGIYLDAFVKTTKDLGYPIKMTYEELPRDFRETFVHGFLIGVGFCTGIGLAVMGDTDPTDVDFDEWARNYTKLVEKWIVDNPEKNEENAKILISVAEEHENLMLS